MGGRDQSISEKDRDRGREQMTDDDLKTNFQISKAQRDRGAMGSDMQAVPLHEV